MGGKRKTLQIMAERPDGGMDVGDCAELSRKLSDVLEAADPIPEEYVLEVSSPGIDRPLSGAADFERFAGYEARVEMTHPSGGRRRFKGNIAAVENGAVVMEVAGDQSPERISLPLSGIAEAKLVLTDRLIQESLKAKDARASKHAVPQQRDSHRRH
jgi:ribosome maturation factor RimP